MIFEARSIMQRFALAALLLLNLVPPGVVRGDAPADDVLALVPPDAGAILVVTSLRDRIPEIVSSPIVQAFRSLPTVQKWQQSDKFADILKGRDEIEKSLGIDLATIRDDLIGDCVVLAVHLPAGRPTEEVSGLLLSHVRDRQALNRLIEHINASEKASGTLLEVEESPGRAGSATVFHRRFAPNTKPDEWYAVTRGDIYAWSNSEALLRGAVERSTEARAAHGPIDRFREARRTMPEASFLQIHADARFLERLFLSEAPRQDSSPPISPKRILAPIDRVGLALEWRDGPILHLRETFVEGRMPLWARPAEVGIRKEFPVMPGSAIAVAFWEWDLGAIYDSLEGLLPEKDRGRLHALRLAVQGVLLGKDLRRDILPGIGPSGFAILEASEGVKPLKGSIGLTLSASHDVAPAIENGLRTLAAVMALDSENQGKEARVKVSEQGGIRVTTLVSGDRRWSFASTPNQLVLGTESKVVFETLGRLSNPSPPKEVSRIAKLRERFFPDSAGFFAVDLAAVGRFATRHAELLARQSAARRGGDEIEARRDLDRALELLRPIGGTFAAWRVNPDRSWVQTIGLVGRSGPTEGR